MRIVSRKTVLGCSAALAALALATGAYAQQRTFNVPAQEAVRAIPEFARQADIQIIAPSTELRGVRTPAVRGDLDTREALRLLLRGTGLEIARDDGRVISLRRIPSPAPGRSAEVGEATTVDEVVVTGTTIRGAQVTSPVVTITQEEMRLSGHNTLGEAIRALPQNFSGGQNPGVLAGPAGTGESNGNITGGSGLNLRGLGQGATLTLLNGSRLPYDGFRNATDVSAIPTSAIERVEILLDGASAVYGSDAIGGVANIILRRDYHGAEISARYGLATDGGYEQQQYTGLFGRTWGSGGFLVTGDLSRNSPVRASDREYLSYLPGQWATIYPESDQKNVLISGHQGLGMFGVLNVDAYYSERGFEREGQDSATVTSDHQSDSMILGVSSSLEVELPREWGLRIHGSAGRNEMESFTNGFLNGVLLVSTSQLFVNDAAAAGIGAEGPLFALPGGTARLSIGGGETRNQFEEITALSGMALRAGENRSRYGYGELYLPLLGEEQGIPFVRRLILNAAVRHERYDEFGDSTTPKIGVLWGVTPAFELRASWGRSFSAPTVRQRHLNQSLFLYPATTLGGAAIGAPAGAQVIFESGGNPDLGPEQAETLAAGFTFRPQSLPDFHLELNWYQIEYTDRIARPVVVAQALSNPAFAPAVTLNPTAAQISQSFAWIGFPEGTFNTNFAGVPYDPARVFAIVHGMNANISEDLLRGIDVSVRYGLDVWGGRLSLNASASWILDGERFLTSAAPPSPIAGVIFFPADFRGRLGTRWSRNGLTLGASLNHTAGVTDTIAIPNVERGSMTTLDLVGDYQMSVPGFGEIGLNLAVTNAFDQPPPSYQISNPIHVNYDSTNYSALGRVISLTLTKRF